LHHLTSPAKLRAMTAVLLLGPNTPLIFMGQEFNASTPFAYFADFEGEVAEQLWKGRRIELQGFDEYCDEAAQRAVLNPCSIDTVRRSTLKFDDRLQNSSTLRLYQDLLHLRCNDAVLNVRPHVRIDGAVLTDQCFVIRWFGSAGRMLVVNLGAKLQRRAIPEPLLAPPEGMRWVSLWSSNHPLYGGLGGMMSSQDKGWQIEAESASFLAARSLTPSG
jgi:maltooligosyltrehalose trehalohydrolase